MPRPDMEGEGRILHLQMKADVASACPRALVCLAGPKHNRNRDSPYLAGWEGGREGSSAVFSLDSWGDFIPAVQCHLHIADHSAC